MCRDAYAGAVSDVEPERFVRAVTVQPHAPVRLGHDVHVDDGRHRTEILRKTDADVRPLPVQIVAQGDHGLFLSR